MKTLIQQFVAHLVPPAPGLRVIHVVVLSQQIVLHLVSTQATARCPDCQALSQRVHSHYQRTLADVPSGTATVVHILHVRKFFCSTVGCPRRTFAERLPTVTRPYARRTNRQAAQLSAVGLALGGQAGSRLAHQLRMPASRPTLLRLVQQIPLPPVAAPQVIGIDEWAYRRGHHYGTLIVDLERQIPIEVLPDRLPATVIAWLRTQPQLRVICRDRSGGFAQAAREGAPQATQVADRWHLVQNLLTALEKFLLNKRALLKQAGADPAPVTPTPEPPPDLAARTTPPTPAQTPATVTARQQRHERLVDIYEQVHVLADQQLSVAAIAQQLGISRATVYRYQHMTSPPSPKRPRRRRSRLLAPYAAYLLQRWNAGCRNALQLYREIKAQGYAYSSNTVERFVGTLRTEHGHARSFRAVAANPPERRVNAVHKPQPYTAYRTAVLFVMEPGQCSSTQRTYLDRVKAGDEQVARTGEQVAAFLRLVRERRGEDLDAWLGEIATQGVAELQTFANGLQADYAAVRAGLSLAWSNGQTEGQVHRLKMLKRQTYGRAGFALMRQRVLARPVRGYGGYQGYPIEMAEAFEKRRPFQPMPVPESRGIPIAARDPVG